MTKKALELITAAFVLMFASNTALADHHVAETTAMAMEASVCTLKEGRSSADMDKTFKAFKAWSVNNNYQTYLVRNTPLYVGGNAQLDELILEFTSYDQMGKGWDLIAANGAEMLELLEDSADCQRSLSHYRPMHNKANWEPDDDRVMTVNWCRRLEGVSWTALSKEHASWTFGDNVGYAGIVIPALGIKQGDFPGEFAHLRVYPDAGAMLAEQNRISNEGGWKNREAYFENFAGCSGSNAYLQSVVIRPSP